MNSSNEPRLYITAEHYARLHSMPQTPMLKNAERLVESLAMKYVRSATIEVDETGHNWQLIRARHMQNRIVTLLTQYKRSGQQRYRDALMDDVRRMADWEYWSWITWRQNDADPNAIFDLSYGENSSTLAIAFDGLRDELSDEEVQLFVDTARRRSLQPLLAVMAKEPKPWWYRFALSNWNTVCAGGAGVLALAMGDLCPESERVLEIAEESIIPYFEALGEDGAWPEGIGYWNYGMRYGFMYLLSWENATGKKHPLMERKGTRSTLTFPLAFSPNGVPCSFGDVNSFAPLPFHYRVAERLNRPDIVAELDRRMAMHADDAVLRGHWPNTAELLLLHPRQAPKASKKGEGKWPAIELQDGLEWGYIADSMPEPKLYVSVRGGTLVAPHVHQDLLSFNCLVGTEKLIENIGVDDYLDTTFSGRRWELYETSTASKNTIFINGVGIADKSTVTTEVMQGSGYRGFRIDATEAMGNMRDGAVASFCGRLILMIKNRGVLVVDRVTVPHAALVESRLHTFFPVTFGKLQAQVRGKQSNLHLAFAASEPSLLKRGLGVATEPKRKPDTMIRHTSAAKVHGMTLCSLLLPDGTGEVQITEKGDRTTVTVGGDLAFKVSFDSSDLRIG